MPYFADHHKNLRLIDPYDDKDGLRENQVGAVMAAFAHFSVHHQPALVCMPTGSGKTAVLMALCYALKARKVLVITPSRLVRHQISSDFVGLTTLKRLGVLPNDMAVPQVTEVLSKVTTPEMWAVALEHDVVVATPNCISPVGDVVLPPEAAFDLVLVDEAHHSPAATWAALLANFPEARQILFTATPFRNDGRLIKAKIIYNYPLRKAVLDQVFGEIEFVPIPGETEDEVDVAIARRVEALYQEDLAQGLNHRIIVRTSLKTRAAQLLALYAEHAPSLKLKVLNSDHAASTILRAVDELRQGVLHGIICVDMFGEGFDMPNLKIAALHAPHRSLAITLQFIGRLARTNDPSIGSAKFVAGLHDIQIEAVKLFQEDSDWLAIIPNLSERRIGRELAAQEFFSTFRSVRRYAIDDGWRFLSMQSFRPFCHVKVVEVKGTFNLNGDLESENHDIVYQEVSDEYQTSIVVWAVHQKPKWLREHILDNVSYELVLVHYHEPSRLMFVCSTDRSPELYSHVIKRFCEGPALDVPLCTLRRAMAGWQDERFSSLGLRNRRYRQGAESYRILAGAATERSLDIEDRFNFVGGHSFGIATDAQGQPVLLGISSTSKLWTIRYVSISDWVEWCDQLGVKVSSEPAAGVNLPLGNFDVGEQVTRLPDVSVIAGEWPDDAFKNARRVRLRTPTGEDVDLALFEMALLVDPLRSNSDTITFSASSNGVSVHFQLSLSPFPNFEVLPDQDAHLWSLRGHDKTSSFIEYLSQNPPFFYFDDGSSLRMDVYYERLEELRPMDAGRIQVVDWATAGVDIQQEVTTRQAGLQSIHDYLKVALLPDFDVVIYDQGAGELADFICFKGEPDQSLVLYHCKGSKEPTPGDRVDDLYEVCGQAVKSARWSDRKLLRENLATSRRTSRRYLKGTVAEALAILDGFISQDLPLEVAIVQPGLRSSPALSEKMSRLLGAVDGHIHRLAGATLRVVCS